MLILKNDDQTWDLSRLLQGGAHFLTVMGVPPFPDTPYIYPYFDGFKKPTSSCFFLVLLGIRRLRSAPDL